LALYVLAPTWLLALSGATVALFLGRLGQPADSPVIHRAVEIPKRQKLTSDIVLRALGALGIAQINQTVAKGREPLAFTSPITREGPAGARRATYRTA
jgi:S-DNA-T family DNA segregation ATPase FtsK/SpoIIIE